MNIYWPRRAAGLPPGQRLMSTMPRFSDRPHIPPPAMPDEPLIEVLHGGKQLGALKRPDLEALGLSEHQADFHCVTTWSDRKSVV